MEFQYDKNDVLYICFLWKCENEIKSLRAKLMLNNENDDENEEKEDSDENDDDDDDEPTLMSRSKHFAKQVY